MLLNLIRLLGGALSMLPLLVHAQCELDDAGLYADFKRYREHVNVATHIDHLTPYFSTAFNDYYLSKLASTDSKIRYLTHYWDNLNTAKDIVIVYDYAVQCANNGEKATLALLVILDQPFEPQQLRVDLWDVKVHYVKEGETTWLIDSFEYAKSHTEKTFEESQIVDNFVVIR
ncbi:hypothetical protein [Kaarinaea lacus]